MDQADKPSPMEGDTDRAPAQKSRAEMSEEEKKQLKEAKKAAKEAAKREKAEKKAAAAKAAAEALAASQALVDGIEFLSIDEPPNSMYGSYRVIQSKCPPTGSGRSFVPLSMLSKCAFGDEVWVRARVHKAVFTSQVGFVTLRKGLHTVQAVLEGKQLLKWAKKAVTHETIVDINAQIGQPEGGRVEKCSVSEVELGVRRIYVVSRSAETLPLSVEDAARPIEEDESAEREEAQKDASQGARTRPRVTRDTRLDARVVDLRAPPHASLMRVQSGVCQLFREFLYANGFMEIHSPKLIPGASEGGSSVFHLSYFDRKACLAQSPQLYKQMVICSDFNRVFEIGPVFRAEKSHTHRHLCEFTGLDLEMEIYEHYNEILDVLDGLFTAIFDGLEKRFGTELAVVRSKWNVPNFKYYTGRPNLRLKWPEAIEMMRGAGVEIGDFEDINTEKEKLLGKLVKEKYDTDFFMLTHFPSAIRPFYTMVDPVDGRYSNSYDLFMRGEEIVSGAQRIHDVELLKTRAVAMLGEEGVSSIEDYVNAFRYGAPPHGGAGIGLERVVMLYLGVENIRECSLFPRDPERLTP
ncbi:Aspartate--tRNA ligase [Gracilaria domingensis]|nr:Aspartate--tRNA ligase [Gracilaria domingensis]